MLLVTVFLRNSTNHWSVILTKNLHKCEQYLYIFLDTSSKPIALYYPPTTQTHKHTLKDTLFGAIIVQARKNDWISDKSSDKIKILRNSIIFGLIFGVIQAI